MQIPLRKLHQQMGSAHLQPVPLALQVATADCAQIFQLQEVGEAGLERGVGVPLPIGFL